MKVISTRVEESFIYNDGYVVVKNMSDKVVKNFSVGILMFDKNGYPINDKYSNTNSKVGKSDTPNIQPNGVFGRNHYWYIDGEAYKIKACVIEAEFYDGTTWYNEYYDLLLEKEKNKYQDKKAYAVFMQHKPFYIIYIVKVKGYIHENLNKNIELDETYKTEIFQKNRKEYLAICF